MGERLKAAWPALLTLLVCVAYVGWRLVQHDGDPVGLAELGRRYSGVHGEDPDGYDGQFAYYLAFDPDPDRVSAHLDVPAYRYQRILYPLVARLLAFGQDGLIPWALIVVNLASHFAATWLLAQILLERGQPSRYALGFGLWVGLVAAVGTDLNEPLAFALIVGAWRARQRRMDGLAALLLALSLFAKETSLLFLGAMVLDDLLRRRWRPAIGLAVGGIAHAAWQLWLLVRFGSLGLGSGGALSTPFELVPLMGLLRIGEVSLPALALFVLIFGPTILLPTGWGLVTAARAAARRAPSADSWALLFNAAPILFLPFSTFREPLGLVRFADGLVLSVVLFASAANLRRALNYSLFWIGLLAMLLSR
ncbi:MAG: hypothetical protein AB1449_10820 [Chloroflexota bacterium]